MSQPSTTYAVINTGSGSPQVISGFGAADGLTLIGFLGPELPFAPTAADATAQGGVHQHLIADGDVHALQLDIYEAGDALPAAVVQLTGVVALLSAGSLTHW